MGARSHSSGVRTETRKKRATAERIRIKPKLAIMQCTRMDYKGRLITVLASAGMRVYASSVKLRHTVRRER